MKTCKAIGCKQTFRDSDDRDYCPACLGESSRTHGAVGFGESNLPTAAEFLRAGLRHMDERAVTHDAAEGERSMRQATAMFNMLTGHSVSETQGWKFMACLKLVRSEHGDFNADDYEDGASYMGLAGESHAKEYPEVCED